jgi:hypothetical protein
MLLTTILIKVGISGFDMSNQNERNAQHEIEDMRLQIQQLNLRIEKLESILSAISQATDIRNPNMTNEHLRNQTTLMGWK